VSKPRSAVARPTSATQGISAVRTGLAAVLAIAGIAWIVYYDAFVLTDGTPKQVFDLKSWNWLIGFGLLFVGLIIAAHPRTPLGRGRGVVVGMLGCFLIGLIWIVVYYVTSQNASVPLIRDLGNYNLLVGIGFMATGFIFATHWE
jgi:hypothetical protein